MSNLLAQIAAQQQAAAAAANPVLYVPTSRQDVIRADPVTRLLAVCHPPGAIAGESGITNHWTLTFDVGNKKSVRLDIQPNPSLAHTNGGQKAHVIVSELKCLVTTSAVRYDVVSVTTQRTVGWYIDYFAAECRFRYAFHPYGVGCRQWQSDTMKLLSDTGNVDKNEAEAARRALACTWPDGRPTAPIVAPISSKIWRKQKSWISQGERRLDSYLACKLAAVTAFGTMYLFLEGREAM